MREPSKPGRKIQQWMHCFLPRCSALLLLWQHPELTHPWWVTKPCLGSVRAPGRVDFCWVGFF